MPPGAPDVPGLTHLDRYVFGEYLAGSEHPIELIGSSIGSWRHATAAAPEPVAALTSLQERYLNQDWDENDPRSAAEIVDELCDWVIESLVSPEVMQHICDHPRYTTHVITARGRGLNNNSAGALLAAGMGVSAIANLWGRGALSTLFQRVVFSTGSSPAFDFQDFTTRHVPLTPSILKTALMASGSIPFLMSGQRDISSAPLDTIGMAALLTTISTSRIKPGLAWCCIPTSLIRSSKAGLTNLSSGAATPPNT